MLDTQWRHFQLERVGSGALAAQGRNAAKALARRGIVLPANGRLERAIQRIERVNDAPELLHSMSDADAALLLEATRDVYDAFLVAYAAVERPRRVNPFPPDRLVCFGQGADSPKGEANPWARNTQFEVVVGAHFLLGGADVQAEEPDYSLLYNRRRVGLAVKRLTSLKPGTLVTRLKEAVEQISDTFGEGFAVVNMDSWITNLSGGSPEEVGAQFQSQLREAYRGMLKVVPKMELRGIIILGTWLRWQRIDGRRQLEWRNPFQFIGLADDEKDEAEFLQYMENLRARWENSMSELSVHLAPSGPAGNAT